MVSDDTASELKATLKELEKEKEELKKQEEEFQHKEKVVIYIFLNLKCEFCLNFVR